MRAPSSLFAHTPLREYGKTKAYRLHRGKCAPVDSPAPSRGKTLRHTRPEPLVPRLTLKSMFGHCQDFLTDPYPLS